MESSSGRGLGGTYVHTYLIPSQAAITLQQLLLGAAGIDNISNAWGGGGEVGGRGQVLSIHSISNAWEGAKERG